LNTFFTADTHFNHSNIIIHCMRRPWVKDNPNYDPSQPDVMGKNYPFSVSRDDLDAHDQALVDAWNKLVGKDDRVFILGDFAFNRHRSFIQRLKGRKVLILGNHDHMNEGCYSLFGPEDSEYDAVASRIVRQVVSDIGDGQMSREAVARAAVDAAWDAFVGMNGSIDIMDDDAYRHFQSVHEMGCRKCIGTGRMKTNKRGFESEVKQDVTMSHYAMVTWASSCYGSWHLHGHSHGRLPERPEKLMFDVGVDAWGYQPVPFEAVEAKMRAKIGVSIDDDAAPRQQAYLANPQERMEATRAKNIEVLKSVGAYVGAGRGSSGPEDEKPDVRPS